MNYFSLGNQFFNLKFSPAEAMVFCAVSSIRNPFSYAICCADSISKRTGLSIRTVYRALEGIQNKGLVCKKKRYRYDGTRASNGYYVSHIGGGQFKVERDIFKYQLDAPSFLVYLYLSKCIDNNGRDAYPSLRKMADRLGLSKTTVIAKIRKLLKLGVIAKLYQRRKRGYCCNQHFVHKLGFRLHIAKKKGRMAMRPSLRPALTLSIRHHTRIPSILSVANFTRNFKRVKRRRKRRRPIFKIGWYRFGTASLMPTLLQQKKE